MAFLDYDKLEQTPVEHDPYDWLVVPQFVRPDAFPSIVEDYPAVPGAGSYPPSVLDIKGRFAELMAELDGPLFRAAVERKFGVDLSDRPTMFTVRGFCRRKDGGIHTNSTTKIVTVLLYMNEPWNDPGGRLRILRSGTDLNDYVAEVPPDGGTLLLFLRSDHSWHGHEPFEGARRAVQMNWVTGPEVVAYEQRRHRLSSLLKGFGRSRRANLERDRQGAS